MLVLTRQKTESLVINDSITITVLEIRGPIVRIGVEADASVPVDRVEVAAKKQSSLKEPADAA